MELIELVTGAEKPPSASTLLTTAPLPPVPKLKRSQTVTGVIALDGTTPSRKPTLGVAALGRVGTLPRRLDAATGHRERLGRQQSSLGAVSEKRRLSATHLDETHEDQPHDADDDATHYFSIETRLELKERLVAVQKQLDGAMVRAKLAWMKCFVVPASSPSKTISQSIAATQDTSHEPTKWAAELVDNVEGLASDLSTAFAHVSASDGSSSLDDYKELVARAENKLATLLELANRIVAADPSSFCRQTIEEPSQSEQTVSSISPSKSGAAQVSFDLPSMKKYSAKVAPPYTAYLPVKERLRNRSSEVGRRYS